MVKFWSGKQLSTWLFENGKPSKKGKPVTTVSSRITDECGTLITEYERDCFPVYQGDILIGEECSSWTPTGNDWFIPHDCDGGLPTCDPNLSSEECICQLFGFCGDGDTEYEDIPPTPPDFTILETNESITTDNISSEERVRNYRWIFLQGAGLTFRSYDKSTQLKGSDGLWRFSSLQHVSDAMSGLHAVWSVSYELQGITPTYGQFHASMHFDCYVRTETSHLGYPIVHIKDYRIPKYWTINDGN